MNLVNIIRFLAALSWLAVFGVIALAVLRATRGRPLRNANGLVIAVAVVALLLNVVASGLVFIQPNERGVVVTIREGGIRPEALTPGLHWVVPYAETVVPYSISRETYTMSIAPEEGAIVGDDSVEARTADGQVVRVDASVIFAVDPARVVDVHVRWQSRYIDGLVRPISRGVVRDAVSQFGIEEVYSSKRLEMTEKIRESLEKQLDDNGIVLVQFILRNIAFSDEYSASIEQKQIAEQLAQQAAFVVEQRRQEAEQTRQIAQGDADASVIRAQGEAEARLIEAEAEAQALEVLAAAIKSNPDVLTLQYIEKLAPNIQVMLLPSNNPFLLPLEGFISGQ
ncbi:MAG: prohibitin family protein [Chloroflexi bacterium]|nr:prohibitin family protein [Chloroflexota bacterium]